MAQQGFSLSGESSPSPNSGPVTLGYSVFASLPEDAYANAVCAPSTSAGHNALDEFTPVFRPPPAPSPRALPRPQRPTAPNRELRGRGLWSGL